MLEWMISRTRTDTLVIKLDLTSSNHSQLIASPKIHVQTDHTVLVWYADEANILFIIWWLSHAACWDALELGVRCLQPKVSASNIKFHLNNIW